ncbi:hypothetical protein XELAEV_18012801mg [Xenopus laevis]|uniref:Uncharacterized protein n=1 Tax=Xenopus laevis TaxID=8355 RepID=A0A974HYG9_XENLA|nr:hypothetical protein XELAEV_18012801mg [Xenopus laevis]
MPLEIILWQNLHSCLLNEMTYQKRCRFQYSTDGPLCFKHISQAVYNLYQKKLHFYEAVYIYLLIFPKSPEVSS